MKSISRKAFLLILLLLPLLSCAQERQLLEEKRQRLIQDIKKAEKLIQETKKSRETTLLRYNTLQAQIKKRKELIQTLEEEVALADQSLLQVQSV
ncbi:hypothetical protein RZS08_16065, partial [Arthrospira platensis SPKY1]|nr:hypothetical protein [Arthrospira platensis SPKY1]